MCNSLLLLWLVAITFGGKALAGRAAMHLPHKYQARSLKFVHKLITAPDADWLLIDHLTKLNNYTKGWGMLTAETIEELQPLVRADIIDAREKSPFVEIFSKQDFTQLTEEEIDQLIEEIKHHLETSGSA